MVARAPRMHSVGLMTLEPPKPWARRHLPLLRLELSCGHVTFLRNDREVAHAAFFGLVASCHPCRMERDV